MIREGNHSTSVTALQIGLPIRVIAVWVFVLVVGATVAFAAGTVEAVDPGTLMPASDDFAGQVTQKPDPWAASQLIEPGQLARALSDPNTHRPLIIYIGPTVLYRAGHVPGAILVGPAAQPSGMEGLQRQLKDLPKDSDIVLYCGCCPWEDCPNIRPAFVAARKMGFTNLKILHLPNSFKQDWTDKKFPVQRSE